MRILKNVRMIDLLWPNAEPMPKDYLQKHEQRLAEELTAIEALPGDHEILEECLRVCTSTAQEDLTRRQGVESRLTTMIGLSSIAGTIVFGAILALAVGTVNPSSPLLRILIVVGGLYATLQICNAILAAVRGLERRDYQALPVSDITRRENEPPKAYLRRRAMDCLKLHSDHELQTQAKVTQMAVAHQAMKNFIGGLCILALVCAFFALAMPSPRSDALIEQLKSDHELRELLRGPQGPPGPTGETPTNHSPCSQKPLSGKPTGRQNKLSK